MVGRLPRATRMHLARLGCGAATLGAGLLWRVPVDVARVAVEPLPIAGTLLLGWGLVGAARRPRAPKAAAPPVPAHVAFLKPRTPTHLAAEAAPAPAPRCGGAPSRGGDTRSDEVRELTRQIARAGVLLGTGRLSEEAYRLCVDDLKERRGRLEADLAAAQLRGERAA